MTKFDDAVERFRMSRLDIDAISHTTFESPEYMKRLIDEAYNEYKNAAIELHDVWSEEQ